MVTKSRIAVIDTSGMLRRLSKSALGKLHRSEDGDHGRRLRAVRVDQIMLVWPDRGDAATAGHGIGLPSAIFTVLKPS
ncbi:MAG: hypothetical protein ABJL98_02845 [Lentilitoribacter sp.]